MKTLAILLSTSMAFIPSSKIEPSSIIDVGDSILTRDRDNQCKQIVGVLVDAQSLRDIESVIVNMPASSTLTPSAVLALIESHRKINKEHYTKKDENQKTEIEKLLIQNQQVLLDAQKATKKTKSLEDEIERLRNKLEGKKTSTSSRPI